MPMTKTEAEELAQFRRLIGEATLAQLEPLILTSLDGLIDLIRTCAPPSVAIETAAAISAELHRRRRSAEPRAWAPTVGNA